MKHLYFGPSFVFWVTALGRFSQCFFYVLSSVNHGGQHFYSAPPLLPTGLYTANIQGSVL